MTKRILHIMGGMNRAGAETMMMNIYRNIDRSKFQFDFLVYSNDKQDYEEEIEDLGGRVVHLPLSPGGSGLIKTVGKIRRIIREGKYSAIHAATLHNSVFPLIAALGIKGCKRITHSHNTANVSNPSILKRIYNKISSCIIRLLSQELLACGQEAGEYLFGKNLFGKKGIVVNNCVDIDRFYNVDDKKIEAIRRNFNLGKSLIIGSVARLHEVKNHIRMLSIASEMKNNGIDFKMIFVGAGDMEKKLREISVERGLNDYIVFAGVRSDVNVWMHVFDVFLMPSFFEGNPVTLIECQSAGTPAVISSSISDSSDLGLGLISKVELEDSDSIWIDKIINYPRISPSYKDILKASSKKGYALESNVKLLESIYSC